MASIVKLTLESNQYERNIKNAQKSLNEFTRSIGINMKSLSGMAIAAGAVTTALKVAKDAFNSSRDVVDEWGRTMQSAQSIYDGFLNALNTGDFSGFFNNMSDIAKAAREAYDAVSDLELLNAWNAGSLQKAKTGFTGSVADFRAGEGSAQGVKDAAEVLKNQLRERKTAEMNALAKAVNDEALKWGLDGKALSNALKENFSDFTNRMHSNKPESYTGNGFAPNWGSFTISSAMTGAISPIRTTKIPGTTDEKLSDFARRATPELIQKLRKYEVMSEATEEEIRQIDKQVTRMLGKAGKAVTGGKGGTSSKVSKVEQTELQQNQKQINALIQEYVKLGDDATTSALERKVAIQGEIAELEKRNNTLKLYAEQAQGKFNGPKLWQGDLNDLAGGAGMMPNVSDSIVQSIDDIRTYLKENPIVVPIETTTRDINAIKEAAQTAAQVVGTIGQAFNAIEDPAAKVAGIVAQAIANVALAYADNLAKDQPNKYNIWSFIAAAAASTISMVSTIAAIHSSTGYAEGGMIKGNSYSGDNLMAMGPSGLIGLNAGEIILNRAQQANVAAGLQGGGLSGMSLKTKVRGTELLVWLDNSLAQSGRGELVTWGQ